jgi:hypothetical protein
MGLIDADSLKSALAELAVRNPSGIAHQTVALVANSLDGFPEIACRDCRFWDLTSSRFAGELQPCRVSGSFRTTGGLYTEADFGCVHYSGRQP